MSEHQNREEVKREVTSLKVNPELWKKAKIQAINEGTTLGELLDEAVRARIADAAKVKALAAKYKQEEKVR